MHGPLRVIFPLTVVALWGLAAAAVAGGSFAPAQWLMLLLAHVACTVIFVSFIYVFNYGYGFATAIVALVPLAALPSAAAALVAGASSLFGLRMLQFTHARYAAPSYAAILERQRQADAAMPLPVKLLLWIFVSWLMAFETMPVWFVARAGRLDAWVAAGTAIMLLGLVVETAADRQKQAAKARDPGIFVSRGLYARSRHPNYLGEMLFQAGLMASCLGAVAGWQEHAIALAAPAYIVVLMIYAGIDADRQQSARYAVDPAYREYRQRTGRFFPALARRPRAP